MRGMPWQGTTTRELIQLGPRHAFNNHAGGCTIL